MTTSYIPAQDSNALIWMEAFAAGIVASPGTYQLAAADATAINNAVTAFATALSIANTNTTRTPVTVAAKDDARTSAEQICRQYATTIKYNAGISDPAPAASS